MATISNIHAREIIDSRANPTIEVDVTLSDGSMGRSAVPSGASTGTYEAIELRDGVSDEYLGKGVDISVSNVNNEIFNAVKDKEFNQSELDKFLMELDGTSNKGRLGANSILGVSLAFAHAVAKSQNIPLFKYINNLFGEVEMKLPRPMFNIMNGGKHANWSTDIQEFMIIFPNLDLLKQIESASEVFMNLEKILASLGLNTNVGNEGGFAPGFKSNDEAFEVLTQAIEKSNFKLGSDVFFALDFASTEFYNKENKTYTLKTEDKSYTSIEWIERVESIISKYPFLSIEDPFSEDDFESWSKFNNLYGSKLQIVGDDLLVTNVERIKNAITQKMCNALLVKPNQIGSLTETLDAMKLSLSANWNNVLSHRSGETEDVTISHIAVGTGCGQIKTGAPSRGERTAKYNELIRISEQL